MTVRAYYGFRDQPFDVPSNMDQVGVLNVPVAGNFVISAKLYLAQGSADPTLVKPNEVTARLEAGADFDVSVTRVGIADTNPFRSNAATVALNVAHTFPAGGGDIVVKLDKRPDTTLHLKGAFLKITAVQVDELHKKSLP
jgi:hypothetical protein